MTDVWDRGYRLDSLAAACRFVESVWHDERIPPLRLHGRGPQPRDLSGAPRWSAQFSEYILGSPNDVETVTTTSEGVQSTRYYYRYPLTRALSILDRRDHDRWTKDVPRQPFHPSVVSVLRAMAQADFMAERVRLRYGDGTRVSADMAELFCIGAGRKLRGIYAVEYIDWPSKSDSQQNAEAGAA
jgi:hypothetical protein